LTKILETIGLNDSEAVNDLRHRLGLLSEENNMLLAHLEELKQLRDNFERINQERTHELEEERRAYEDARRSLEEALVREELLTNYKQVTEPKLREAQNRIQELEAEMQDIVEELHNTKNQCVLATNQAQQYKK
jgi:Bacteriophytochrome (light-regulated signal transduction histidine kinase)